MASFTDYEIKGGYYIYMGQEILSYDPDMVQSLKDFVLYTAPSSIFDENEDIVVLTKDDGIVSVLTYRIFQSKHKMFCILSNLCTRKGKNAEDETRMILVEFLKWITTQIQRIFVWIGIKFNDRKRIKMLAELGFHNPRITNKEPDMAPHSFAFLSLIKEVPTLFERQQQNIAALCDTYISSYLFSTTPKDTVELDNASLDLILKQIYSNDRFEIGGVLFLKGNILSIDPSKVIKGSEEDFTVETIQTDYSFHTHPIESYIKLVSILGFPSQQDFIVTWRNGCKLEIVFSLEGIYCLLPHPLFRQFWKIMTEQHSECIEHIDRLLRNYYDINAFRLLSHVKMQDKDLSNIREYLHIHKDRASMNPYLYDAVSGRFDKVKKYISNLSSNMLVQPTKRDTPAMKAARAAFKNCLKRFTDIPIPSLFSVDFISWYDINALRDIDAPVKINIYRS